MTQLRTLDLFSGIGGFSLGLEQTGGFRTVAFCEIDPFCRRVLARHWPEAPCYHDVRTLTADRLAADGLAVDAICGGFPCQDISVAGRGAGLVGERSGLWREYARLVRELRPRLVFVENVTALLYRGLGEVLGDLAAVGYDAWWDCIPASAVGAPHRRDRIWLVAYAGSLEHQGFGDAIRGAVAAGLLEAHLADAARLQPGWPEQRAEWQRTGAGGQPVASDVADATGERINRRWAGAEPAGRHEPANGREALADPEIPGLEGRGVGGDVRPLVAGSRQGGRTVESQWLTEPDVGRVAHGVPARVDRLRSLGNAVVPQIPEVIGQAVLQLMERAA